MINLLPSDLKLELAYSRRNRVIANYIALALGGFGLAALTLWGTRFYLGQRLGGLNAQLQDQRQQIDQLQSIEGPARTLKARLDLIKALQTDQAHFSALLSDLAKVTPKGAYITQIALTGDATKPVRISANAGSYAAAVTLRDGLAASPRIAAADIVSVSNAAGTFHIDINLAFKPGAAK